MNNQFTVFNDDSVLDNVLHIYHEEWLGIRSATEALRGHLFLVNSEADSDVPQYFSELVRMIERYEIEYIFFQGFSVVSELLASKLKRAFSNGIKISAVTHCSPAQFDHQFEIDMIARMIKLKHDNVLSALFSVKDSFSDAVEEFSNLLLINDIPDIPEVLKGKRDVSLAYIPLARGLRKNAHSNHIALIKAEKVKRIISTVSELGLNSVLESPKVIHSAPLSPSVSRRMYSQVGLVANVTLIECQPMVFNESLAAGTPCLTGPLYLPFLKKHELRSLTEIQQPDSIKKISAAADTIIELWQESENVFLEIISDYRFELKKLSKQSYLDALSVVNS